MEGQKKIEQPVKIEFCLLPKARYMELCMMEKKKSKKGKKKALTQADRDQVASEVESRVFLVPPGHSVIAVPKPPLTEKKEEIPPKESVKEDSEYEKEVDLAVSSFEIK